MRIKKKKPASRFEEVVLNVDSLSPQDIAILTKIAQFDEENPPQSSDNTWDAPELVRHFNLMALEDKKQAIIFARNYLGETIETTDSTELLHAFGSSVLNFLHGAHKDQAKKFIEHLGLDALLRLSMTNTAIAELFYVYLVQQMDAPGKEWLTLVLNLELPINKRTEGDERTLLDKMELDGDFTGKILLLYLRWPQLKENFRLKLHEIAQVPDETDEIIQQRFQDRVAPFVLRNFPLRPGKSLEIQKALERMPLDKQSWLYVCLATLDADAWKKPLPQEHELDVSDSVNHFGRNHLLFALEERFRQRGDNEALEITENYWKGLIEPLDEQAKHWLFFSLWLGDFMTEGVPKPEDEALQRCEKILAAAKGSTLVWRQLNQILVTDLGKESVQEIFHVIPEIFRLHALRFPKEMRLWLHLAIATKSRPPLFSLLDHVIHEKHIDKVIRQTVFTDAVESFQKLAENCATSRNMIDESLLRPEEGERDQTLPRLPLYLSHHLQSQLKCLDPNALSWLYIALSTNTHLNGHHILGKDCQVTLPSGPQLVHAQTILDAVQANLDLLPQYVENVERLLTPEKAFSLSQFIEQYLELKLKKLNKSALDWLHLALATTTSPLSFEVGYGREIMLPEAAKTDCAKILITVCANPRYYSFLKEKLVTLGVDPLQFNVDMCQLGSLASSFNETGQFTYNLSSDPCSNERLVPFLLNSVNPETRQWLAQSLADGVIDSKDCIKAQKLTSLISLSKELIVLPKILALALKSPDIRQRIVRELKGPESKIEPLTRIHLDGLPFGDWGLITLSHGLKNQSQQLTHFSMLRTGITDKGLEVFSDCVVGRAPNMKLIRFHDNERITEWGLRSFFNRINKRCHPVHKVTGILTLSAFLKHPASLGWVYSHLKRQEMGIMATQRSIAYYMPPEFEDEFAIGKIILDEFHDEPYLLSIIKDILEAQYPISLLHYQLTYAAIHNQNEFLTRQVIKSLLESTKNQKITEWLKNALISGQFILKAKEDDISEEESIQLQLAFLLISSSKAQRYALATELGIDPSLSIPDIRAVDLEGFDMPDIAVASLVDAIKNNPNTLKMLSLSGLFLEDTSLKSLCAALKSKKELRYLEISRQPVSERGARAVAKLIESNHGIDTLKFSDNKCGEAGIFRIIESLPRSNLRGLRVPHESGIWDLDLPLRAEGVTALAKVLPNCGLRILDLSGNPIGTLGAIRLAAALGKNPRLEALYLRKTQLGAQSIAQIAKAVEKNSSLTILDLADNPMTASTEKSISKIEDKLLRNREVEEISTEMSALSLSQGSLSTFRSPAALRRCNSSPCMLDPSTPRKVLRFSPGYARLNPKGIEKDGSKSAQIKRRQWN